MAPGGGFTTTGGGDTGGAATLGVADGVTVGETEGFADVVCAGAGLTDAGRTGEATTADATTSGVGVGEVE